VVVVVVELVNAAERGPKPVIRRTYRNALLPGTSRLK